MSGGNDKTIKVWREVDSGSWVCDRTITGHLDWVRAVTIFNKRVNETIDPLGIAAVMRRAGAKGGAKGGGNGGDNGGGKGGGKGGVQGDGKDGEGKEGESGHGGGGHSGGGYGGRWLVSGADDDTVKVWNMSTSKNHM